MLLVTCSPIDARVQRGGVIDTGGKFAAGIVDIGGKFSVSLSLKRRVRAALPKPTSVKKILYNQILCPCLHSPSSPLSAAGSVIVFSSLQLSKYGIHSFMIENLFLSRTHGCNPAGYILHTMFTYIRIIIYV
jgi:hypothetical protein